MVYIPEQHLKYHLLPGCAESGHEVFEYPMGILDAIQRKLPDHESLTPYGRDSYAAYDEEIDGWITHFANDAQMVALLNKLKRAIHALNVKEDWIVARYIGPTLPTTFGLTHNCCYYWPYSRPDRRAMDRCTPSEIDIRCVQVIDDGEFTSYAYALNPDEWVILEDPLGVAALIIAQRRALGPAPATDHLRVLVGENGDLSFDPEQVGSEQRLSPTPHKKAQL